VSKRYRLICTLVKITICLALFPSFISAFAAEPKAAEDPQLFLQRVRSKIKAHLSQLHNYTCHVVIDRLVRSISVNNIEHRDRVEIEVAFVGDKELFSRPGQARFGDQSIDQIVPLGMIGNDAFGSHDDDIFSGDAATFEYAGSCKKDGRKTLRYKFRVPETSSLLFVKRADAGGAMVGYQGTVWVDAETLDLVRLEWKTDHIPASVGISSVQKSMRYKIVTIGNSDFLLPFHSELASFDQSGNYRVNMISLDHCLEFNGDSVVTYGTVTEDATTQRRDPGRKER
jgi:hypothetical protein